MLNTRTAGFIGVILFLCSSWVAFSQAPETAPTLTVDQAVQTALSQNLTLRNARLEITAARARIASARSAQFPSVAATGQYTHLTNVPVIQVPSPVGPPQSFSTSTADNIIGVVSTRLAVYTGGRVQAQVSRAEAQYDATVSRLASTESQVAFQTRSAYYAVLLNESLVRSNEQSLASARAQLTTAQARFEIGTSPRFDVLRAETQVSEAVQNLTQSQTQVETSRVTLNRILGVPLSRTYNLVQPGTAPALAENLDTLISIAEGQRAELLSAQAQVQAAEAGIRLARADLIPELDLVANYQTVQKTTPAQVTGWTLSAVLNWALFNGGRTQANVAEAKALTAEAQTNLEDTSRLVEQEVRQAYADLQSAAVTIDTAKSRLAQAQEAYDIAVVRYEAGVGTATELADVLATLSVARTNLDRALFNYNISYAGLQRALGRVTF